MFPSDICIVDDDTDFVDFLSEYLRLRGCRCSTFTSAEELIGRGNFEEYDFFILDLGLPGIDGVELAALIRGSSNAGILVVSGRLGPDAFNSALAAGADMFIAKPVRLDQVSHAIQSIWRRYGDPRARLTPWSVTGDMKTLISPLGLRVALTVIEGRLLEKLRQSNGEATSRADLCQTAGISGNGDHRNLDAAMFRLRRKIEREAGCPSPFRTVHGIGYQLAEDVDG
jgi:two-component system OmpR family response regulator